MGWCQGAVSQGLRPNIRSGSIALLLRCPNQKPPARLEGPDLRRMDTTIATRANKPENDNPAIGGARRTREQGGRLRPLTTLRPALSKSVPNCLLRWVGGGRGYLTGDRHGDRYGDRHGGRDVAWTCRGHHGPDAGVARRRQHRRRRCQPQLRRLPRRSLVCRPGSKSRRMPAPLEAEQQKERVKLS